MRRGEGATPYRNDGTPAKVSLYSNSIPLGGRGTPLPYKGFPLGTCREATDEGLSFTLRLSYPDPSFVTRIATLTLVPPFPKGEGISGCYFITSFRQKR